MMTLTSVVQDEKNRMDKGAMCFEEVSLIKYTLQTGGVSATRFDSSSPGARPLAV